MKNKAEDKLLAKEMNLDPERIKALKKKLGKIEPRSERGVETLFRLVSKNHYTLNTMVDRKSNIMISMNAIIMSIIIGTVMQRMSQDPHLIIPIIMMLFTNITSIVFAIFSTRPEFTHGEKLKDLKHSSNPIFFGNFHNMSEEDYIQDMRELMYSGDNLYDSISKDVYYLGKKINKKFKFLRWSFSIFMFGIVSSVLVFIVCHLFFGDGVFS